ncbi:MAG TPA: peptidylprolyl isomerase [Novosphingobium sp.]|nr:peptidylprolyl isomerase [Novosphingobium sp.]
MHKSLIALAALAVATPALPQASAAIASGKASPSPLAPSEIVARAPKTEWMAIAQSDLLVMDLSPDAKGKPRRVVIQLMPAPFSQGWIGNIRKLAAARFWDGTSINRVQDNYVVQWGDPEAEDKARAKALPAGLASVPQSEYQFRSEEVGSIMMERARAWKVAATPNVLQRTIEGEVIDLQDLRNNPAGIPDPYAPFAGIHHGWPLATDGTNNWPVHCYGMVGVGRDMPPSTGTGAELYTVIGHAPRHLDRNIALVGRVIEGIEHLSSLPRGHGDLGFYDLAQGDQRVTIQSIRIGTEVNDLPAYEYLSTESASFAAYADARANRRDAFFIRPAGGADICNVPVPVRRAK